jgi:hypothetical protein
MSLSAGSGSPGTGVVLNLSMTDPTLALPASLQWVMTYPTTDFSAISVVAGGAATSASKTISCNNAVAGTSACVVYGLCRDLRYFFKCAVYQRYGQFGHWRSDYEHKLRIDRDHCATNSYVSWNIVRTVNRDRRPIQRLRRDAKFERNLWYLHRNALE